MKQTAVEFLFEQFSKIKWDDMPNKPIMFEQAKAMEEEQKIQFATEYSNHILNHGLLTPTEFFKQNFKSK